MATTVPRRQRSADSQVAPLVLRLHPVIALSEDQFFALCGLNRDLRIERNAEGDLLLMAPTGAETGERNSKITARLCIWAERDGRGVVYDSSTGFRLSNGAVRSPDAAWLLRSRRDALPAEQRAGFLPLCPDFVLELRSPSDRLPDVQAKLDEYLANGAQLGWLLDPEPKHVYVYRPAAPVERLENPATVAGDPLLPGFVLNLREIW